MKEMSSEKFLPSLKPLHISDILDLSIKLWRKNWVTFVGIYALVFTPFWILYFLLWVPYFQLIMELVDLTATSTTLPDPTRFLMRFLGSFGGMIVLAFLMTFIVQPIATCALARAISERFLGNAITVTESYRYVFKRFLPLFVAMLLYTLAVQIGFYFLIIPGIIALIFFAFVAQVVAIENIGYVEALQRSWDLTKNHFWKVLFVLLLLSLLVQAIILIFTLPFSLLMFLSTTRSPEAAFKMPLSSLAALVISSAMMTIFLEPIKMVGRTLLYYDLRIRKEGFDLHLMAKELGYERELKVCSTCHASNSREAKFCGACGTNLG